MIRTKVDVKSLSDSIHNSLSKFTLSVEDVLNACDVLSEKVMAPECFAVLVNILDKLGMASEQATNLIKDTSSALKREHLHAHVVNCFGVEDPFVWRDVRGCAGMMEKFVPCGVLVHVAPSNDVLLPFLAVIEGLLTGNVNLLKLPSTNNEYAEKLIELLTNICENISHFIYVFNVNSSNTDAMKKILSLADVIAVWGSDNAVSGIKALANVNTKVVSWGHKIGIGYVSAKKLKDADSMEGLAHDVCYLDQLACSSPQCIFIETDDREQMLSCAEIFAGCMDKVSRLYVPANIDFDAQAEITTVTHLARLNEMLHKNVVIESEQKDWRVIVGFDSELCSSPLYRTVWMKPIKRENIIKAFKPYGSYLQTVSLAAMNDEADEIERLLLQSGVVRIRKCGDIFVEYAGEPHDGLESLRQYVKKVSVQR